MLADERKPLILPLHPGRRKHDVNKSPLVVSPSFAFFLPAIPADKEKNCKVRANSCQVLLSHPQESMYVSVALKQHC